MLAKLWLVATFILHQARESLVEVGVSKVFQSVATVVSEPRTRGPGDQPSVQARLKRRDAPNRDDAGAAELTLAEVGLNGPGSLGLFILTFIIFHQWLKDATKCIMQHGFV